MNMTAPRTDVSREHALGIYLHIPFCQARCGYCAFYTVADQEDSRSRFVHALEVEIESVATRGWVAGGLALPAPAGRRVDTVYLGGGTPSLLSGSEVARLLQRLDDCFTMAPGAEITLEANPETVTPGAAERWLEAGVTRVSLGAQTFHDSTLRSLGRLHDAAAIRSAVARLRRAGCTNLSLDLIAGVDTRGFEADLEAACHLAPEHLSVYLLEVDEAEVGKPTPLARRVATGRWRAPAEDWYAEAYPRAVERLSKSGLTRYEICSFARTGRACHHNLKYWHSQEVIGFGPSAHSLVSGRRFAVTRDLGSYLDALERGQQPALELDDGGDEQRAAETLFLALRLAAGVDPIQVARRTGRTLGAEQWRELRRLAEAGLLEWEGPRMRLTLRGVLLSNEVFQAVLP
jgi:oxygen-independent coproporphyrinogen-3 oxidase